MEKMSSFSEWAAKSGQTVSVPQKDLKILAEKWRRASNAKAMGSVLAINNLFVRR